MDCETSFQSVLYFWSKEGKTLPSYSQVNGSILTISRVKESDSGVYICSVKNNQTSFEIRTVLLVTGVVPRFHQNPMSYMSLATIPDAYSSFQIELSIKAENPDGIILYNGQQAFPIKGDFIALGLHNGYIEFSFELGSGSVTLRSNELITLNRWYKIKIRRDNKNGELEIEGQSLVKGSAQGNFQGLDLLEPMFIGSVPDFSKIHPSIGFKSGFVGCINGLRIGSIFHDLFSESDSFNITVCPTCDSNPCFYQGICQESQFGKVGHKCICPPGFSGHSCEKVGATCYPDLCNNGSCIVKENDGYKCICPLGKSGDHCEDEITILEPYLIGDGYIAYPTPLEPLKSLEIMVKIKNVNESSIIMYSSQDNDGHGDFISLILKNNFIEFSFNTGSGIANLKSSKNAEQDKWINIRIEREHNYGSLWIDDDEPVKGTSPGHTKGLNLKTLLYLGGISKMILMPQSIGLKQGFNGCFGYVFEI